MLNLTGTGAAAGRLERSGPDGGSVSPRPRTPLPGPRGAALPSLAKRSAPWGLSIRGRIGMVTPLCVRLLLWRLRPAAGAGRGVV